ncbi:MAG: dephospho-CoA kinase [Hyphomicrobiales bacterium]
MIVLGLTGSIGMGKSTTADFFRQESVPVFDADATVHDLYQGKAVAHVERRFPGTAIDGRIDRQALATALMRDPSSFSDLERIIHPLVRQAELDFIDGHKRHGASVVVLDIPLLFESGGDELCDKVAVVTAPKAVQRLRVMARPGMTDEKFEQMLSRQMSDADKRDRADFLIFTDKGMNAARQQVRDILHALT